MNTELLIVIFALEITSAVYTYNVLHSVLQLRRCSVLVAYTCKP